MHSASNVPLLMFKSISSAMTLELNSRHALPPLTVLGLEVSGQPISPPADRLAPLRGTLPDFHDYSSGLVHER